MTLAAVPHAETAGGRKSAYKRGLAIAPASPGGAPGFPVTDARHWEKARQAIGRVKNPARRAAVAALLRRTASRFGKTAALKQSWAAPGGSSNANTGPAMEFAMPPTLPVTSPYDLVISRGDDGSAVVRHRRGGFEITRIRRTGDGGWLAEVSGKELTPHTRQRGALLEAIGTWNRGAATAYHRPAAPAEPLQPKQVQTPMMQMLGIPAINAQLATPTMGASDGPRVTAADGLNPRGKTIHAKLVKRGFPHGRALAFARRAQNKTRGGFGK